MVGETRPESVSVRFGAYIDELREFFSSRNVRFGAPEDLQAFADRVAEPGPFQDEMGSMVRSIVYREDQRLGRGELLELVAVAVGGPEVEGAAQGMQASVRQTFVFLNAALRQQREPLLEDAVPDAPVESPVPPAPAPTVRPESHVTAGDILAASAAAEQLRLQSEARKEKSEASTEKRSPIRASAPEPIVREQKKEPAPELASAPPSSNAVLFRAVSMAAEEDSHAPSSNGVRRSVMKQQWFIPAVAAGLAVVGFGVYAARPSFAHLAGTPKQTAALDTAQTGSGVGTCVAPMAAGVTRTALAERARWAHSLLNQKLYEAALPELRDIARLDPGFPGIQLDQSDALLNLKRPEEARDAVDGQIVVSECLAKLPPASLDAYCSAQYTAATRNDCRPQLAHLREAAQLQAALVHLELGHEVEPEAGTRAALAELNKDRAGAAASAPKSPAAVTVPRERRVPPLPPATEGDDAQAPMPRAATRPLRKQGNGDESLMHGDGTDASYGAYEKPQ